MTTKRLRREEKTRGRKKKKSTRILYFSVILGGIVALLVFFFVLLFNTLFPPVNTDSIRGKAKQIATIYFSDPQERFLMPETRYVIKEEDPALKAKEIVKALLAGSKEGLVNTFPAGVAVNDVRVDAAGTAFVNFDKNLVRSHPGGSTAEMATIYSLTNSLTANIPEIKKVKILMEGKELPSIGGHISTKNAFLPNPELLIPAKEKSS